MDSRYLNDPTKNAATVSNADAITLNDPTTTQGGGGGGGGTEDFYSYVSSSYGYYPQIS